MSKKRVFDKNLGVELVVDEEIEDELNKSNLSDSGRKKAKFDSNQSSSNQRHSSVSQPPRPPSTISNINLWPSGTNNDEDEDVEDSDNENFEDIDYGDGDDDDEFNSDGQFASQIDKSPTSILEEDDEHGEQDYKMFKRKRRLGASDTVNDGDSAQDDDDEQGERVEKEGEQTEEKETAERCKYWPTCNAGSDCSYYHPTKQCRAFPNCRFGNKCLYIHPPCKFNPNCTRPACPFAHPLTASLSSRLGHSHFRTVQLPQAPKCKYGFNCNNVLCKFSHHRPEPCRFGANCLLDSCPYTHPSDVVRKKPASAFKWQANN